MTSFSRSLLELTVLFLHVAPFPSIYKSSFLPMIFCFVGGGLRQGSWLLGRSLPFSPFAGIQNKLSFPSKKENKDKYNTVVLLHKVIRQSLAISLTMQNWQRYQIYGKTTVQNCRESYHLVVFEDLKFSFRLN